jgi:hypothetical protein
MSLAPGARLGAYEIAALIGAGGMGEVYRAHDTRLRRDVAVKVLPDTFINDAERLARFRREAQVLASLKHPHIAQIYGLESAAEAAPYIGTFLVLELVQGETLAERIARGPIPMDEALPIAKQIAEALEAAHEQGIIHRDLKPANIKITPVGTVKVLDFGLAKAIEGSHVGRDFSRADLSASPTITSPAMTMRGVIVGTAVYISPEQARGKPVDKRSDIWAFGCVLYEMLTGRRVFEGEDVTEVLARLLEHQPDLAQLPSHTPPPVRRLIQRCLEKDPKRRLRDIGDARLELESAAVDQTAHADPVVKTNAFVVPRWGAWLTAAILVALGVAAVLGWQHGAASARLPAVSRFVVPVPSGFQMLFGEIPSLAIAPDGTTVVFEMQGQLHMRALDRFESEPIPGTDGGITPFFSPDGTWLIQWRKRRHQQSADVVPRASYRVQLRRQSQLALQWFRRCRDEEQLHPTASPFCP